MLQKTAILAGVAAALAVVVTGCSEGTSAVSTVTQTVTETSTAAPSGSVSLREVNAPDGDTFKQCSDQSGVSGTVTSCAFARNVSQEYLSNPRTMVHAYSPTTGQWYWMQCSGDFTAITNEGQEVKVTRCVGGNNAVVFAFH